MSTANPSPNEFFTRLVWANLWNPQSKYYLPKVVINGVHESGINIDPLGNIAVPNVPASGSFELMKSDNLASWLPVKTGYVGIQFSNVFVQGLGSMTDGGLNYTDNQSDPTKGSMEATIRFPANINIVGDYVVVATGLAQCALDTAGALSFLPIPHGLRAEGVEGAENAPDPVEPYLNAARAQRSRLWQTPNGGQMMDKFYDHNEVYNWMFQNNESMQESWVEPANTYFMKQTYEASGKPDSMKVNNGVYNSPDNANNANDDDGMTYNENAFAQQITMSFAALGIAQNPKRVPAGFTSEQFAAAATAASKFGTGPVQSTGNTDEQTTPLTVNEVYGHVASGNSASFNKTAEADRELLKFPVDPVPYTLETLPMTPFQRSYLDKMQARAADREAMLAAGSGDASATLVRGSFSLQISGGSLVLDADITFPNTGAPTATAKKLKANIHVTGVNIKNISDWYAGSLSSIGHQIDQALANSDSIRNLIADKVNDSIGSEDVLKFITNWVNDTFAKVLGPLVGE